MSPVFDLVVRGAEVVTGTEVRVADVGVTGERVAAIERGLAGQGRREVDGRGKLLFPGGVDPHVHLTLADMPMDGVNAWIDDFESGSRAAVAGGVTTLGNMSFTHPEESIERGLERDRAFVERLSLADGFMHPVMFTSEAARIDELRAVWERGQPSLKLFMSFPAFDAGFAAFTSAMRVAAEHGVMTLIHCEDAGCLLCSSELLRRFGCNTHAHYGDSRPTTAEVVAVNRAIGLCELTRCRTYIVHLSSAPALDACRAARARGLPVYVETRPMYLYLTDAVYSGPEGALYTGQPPLRGAVDREALWDGLLDGSIDTVASDHAAWPRAAKLGASLHADEQRPGIAELETMLPLLFSEGVRKRGMSLERFAQLSAENAAKLFGLYPRKGVIAVGADADFALWDPSRTRTVRARELQSRSGYSVYEGMQVTGWPELTVRRGQVVFDRDTPCALPGSGRFITRTRA